MNPEEHFNVVAGDYDFWKKKNWYYYQNLKKLLTELIPTYQRVLEIGCGTGDLLVATNPSIGLGVDISGEMINLAKRKHQAQSNLRFSRQNIVIDGLDFEQDFVFMCDVLEHVQGLPEFMRATYRLMSPGATLVITVANPLWEPALMLAEKLGMKMPEGPHERLSIVGTERIFHETGFVIVDKDYRLLIPKNLPGSDWVNSEFYKKHFLARFGFVVYWVLRKEAAPGISRAFLVEKTTGKC